MSRSSQPLSQDVVFDILSNARRRYVLFYLRKAGEPVELGELAQELAAWENETSIDELTKQQRKRVYVSLYQTHIQKLSEAGIIEYDSDTGMVTLGDNTDQLAAYLSVDEEADEPPNWELYYIILAGIGGILYALVALDVSVFALGTELGVGVAIIGAFAALAIFHYLDTRSEDPDIPPDALIRKPR